MSPRYNNAVVLLVLLLSLPAAGRAAQRARTPKRPACASPIYLYQSQPDSPRQADEMRKCLRALGREKEAGEIFRMAARKQKGPPIAWKFAAESFASASDIADAESSYESYTRVQPADLDARMTLAALFIRDKANDKAQAQYEAVLKQKPDYWPAMDALARVLSWGGHNAEALRLYETVLRAQPRDSEALTGRAFIFLWTGRIERARDEFARLHKRYPKDTAVAQGLDQAQAILDGKVIADAAIAGRTAEVEAVHRRRLAEDPNDLVSLRAMAQLTAGPAHCEEWIGYRRKLHELAPGEPRNTAYLATALSTCDHFEEAVGLYREFLRSTPNDGEVQYELAHALRRLGRAEEAIPAYRESLKLNPAHSDARLGLAMALASMGEYPEALASYDQVLQTRPDSYEAMQGKASLLFWMGRRAESRAIFVQLKGLRPDDPLNTKTIAQIDGAEEDARWAAIRPKSDAPPADWRAYYEKRLEAYPNDAAAMKGYAYVLAQLKDNDAAIQQYRKVLDAYPDDRSSQMSLARLVSFQGGFDEAIELYRKAVESKPEDTEALESLARVQGWANRPADALATYQRLLAANPANVAYQLQVAQLQLRLKNSSAARLFLMEALAADPNNREALFFLANMNLDNGNLDGAIVLFDRLLKRDPGDTAAKFGKARAEFYSGQVAAAYPLAADVLRAQPDDIDAMFLMAALERARANRGGALALLDQVLARAPNHTEALALKKSIVEAGRISLHTSASFTRETGRSGQAGGPEITEEDLRTFNYGASIGFDVLPKTSSTLSLSLMPSETPLGGLRGAAGPSQLFYSQKTSLTRTISVRAGAGLVRFGSGALVNFPGQPSGLPSARFTPLAMAGINVAATKKIRLDFAFNRSAVAYTPTAARFGVVDTGLGGSASFTLTPRTSLLLGYDYGIYHTRAYDHTVSGEVQRFSDRNVMHRGTATLNRTILQSSRFLLEAGYSGTMFGNPGPAVFLGFFNPAFTQSHLFVTHTNVRMLPRIRFDLRTGVGAQQTAGESVRRGIQFSPAFDIKASSQFSFGFGYTYYNTAQLLSTLSGNAFYLTTDWHF